MQPKASTFYRNIVRNTCFTYRPPEYGSEEELQRDFRQYLEIEYRKQHALLDNLLVLGAPQSKIVVNQAGKALLAIGLLAFGQIDVADAMLDSIPFIKK